MVAYFNLESQHATFSKETERGQFLQIIFLLYLFIPVFKIIDKQLNQHNQEYYGSWAELKQVTKHNLNYDQSMV